MNRYDKDMMHERELIYDAKKQEKKGSKKTKKHDKELIYDAKGDKMSTIEHDVEGVDSVKLSLKGLKAYRDKFPVYVDADSFAIQE